MTAQATERPLLLLIGGGGGMLGRAVLPDLVRSFRIRSVHRRATSSEGSQVDWVPGDVANIQDWTPILGGVDTVVNLAWYRWASPQEFFQLQQGLQRLVSAARAAGVRRFIQVSVPPAPASLEERLPYLVCKRRVDATLVESGLSYRILRPTMLFGPGDVLLGVMLSLMHRYGRFPMFGDGAYHVSPIAAVDVARILHREAMGSVTGTLDLGGPERFPYRALTDKMFQVLGRRPRYWRMSPTSGRRLARLMVAFGSTLLYPYEVDWLVSDMLGLAPAEGVDPPLATVDSYLEWARDRLR